MAAGAVAFRSSEQCSNERPFSQNLMGLSSQGNALMMFKVFKPRNKLPARLLRSRLLRLATPPTRSRLPQHQVREHHPFLRWADRGWLAPPAARSYSRQRSPIFMVEVRALVRGRRRQAATQRDDDK